MFKRILLLNDHTFIFNVGILKYDIKEFTRTSFCVFSAGASITANTFVA